MSKIINVGPLAFYDSVKKQHHNKPYAFGQMWPLIVDFGKVPAFQFIANPSWASSTGSAPEFVALVRVDENGNEIWTERPEVLKEAITAIGYETHTIYMSHDLDNLSLIGKTNNTIESGCYYIVVGDSLGNTYYSDIFAYKSNLTDAIRLEYSNSYNLRIGDKELLFDGSIRPFKPYIYIDAQLGRPEYKFEEEVVSRLGYEYIESQVSKKVYKFNFVAQEYLIDALRIIRLCDNKKCTFEGEEYEMLVFDFEADWKEQGDLATVNASFEVDNIIANIGGLIKQ